MRVVCICVQNSQTTVGLFEGDVLSARWRLSTDTGRTADEWGLQLTGLVGQTGEAEPVDGVSLCSAVPSVLHELRIMIAARFPRAHAVVVGPGVRSGLPLLTDNPREVGTDRIANAIGAIDLVGPPCIVVDIGTATTFDVVNGKGEYVGGAIAPGILASMEALASRNAQLRQVELVAPRSAIAKNTVEALQSGAIFGFAGQVDALAGRMGAELGLPAGDLPVVATGTYADLIASHCENVTHHEPWLSLTGLRIIFDRNPR